ncbi:MAG: LLM class F420-dependent oxidoreductase [Acidimicrobiia bacterium]
MKLAAGAGYWASGPPAGALDSLLEAERLGYDSFWTAEAYGSDALTPLAWWGSRTSRIKLGTSIVQLSARTPSATAMAALTLDHLSEGRFILGLGVSGPQVVEGWYGEPYPRPLARTREYVEIVRLILQREAPVEFHGEFYDLPYRGGEGLPAATGLGKPLKSTVHPRRRDLPIYLAAEGPKNVALSAELTDGWLPLFFSPRAEVNRFYADALAEGFARPGARGRAEDFEVICPVSVVVDDDVSRAADKVRPMLALYIGGMGARGANFHYETFVRMGYERQCEQIQDLYLSGRKEEAAAAVSDDMVQAVALVGPRDKIRDDLQAWEGSVVTTLLVSGGPSVLRLMAELCL